jgi:uncharacterized membrane protein YeaQ/YmgE (transglycosylase-associated protein family)
MSGVGIFWSIVIGIAAGFIAEKALKRKHGLLTNLVVGLVGALLGGFIAALLGFGYRGLVPSLIVSTLGAILLLLIVDKLRGRRT